MAAALRSSSSSLQARGAQVTAAEDVERPGTGVRAGPRGGSGGRHEAREGFEDKDTWSRRQHFTGSPGRSGGRARYNLRNLRHGGDGLSGELAFMFSVMV